MAQGKATSKLTPSTPELETVHSQAILFLDWLHELITQRNYLCPQCHNLMSKLSKTDLRPQFVCRKCKVYHNALENTRFKGLQNIHLWIPYAMLLIEGHSNIEIMLQITIGQKAVRSWRRAFIAQMQDRGLNELVQWLQWRRKHNATCLLKINRWRSSLSVNHG